MKVFLLSISGDGTFIDSVMVIVFLRLYSGQQNDDWVLQTMIYKEFINGYLCISGYYHLFLHDIIGCITYNIWKRWSI